jgi:hypothetical protein
MSIFLLVFILALTAAAPPKIIGPETFRCSPRRRFDSDGVSVPLEDWKKPMHSLAVRELSGTLHSCRSQLLCPEHLHCDFKTRSCKAPSDWISSLVLHCPSDDSCLAHCFVSFHVLLDVVFKEFIVFLASITMLAAISNLVSTEFYELPT